MSKVAIKKWVHPTTKEVRLYLNDGMSRAKVWLFEQNGEAKLGVKAESKYDFDFSYRKKGSHSLDLACGMLEYVCEELKIDSYRDWGKFLEKAI